MANQLAMDKALAIKALAAAGRSERQLAAALSVSRKAVRRHLGRSNSKETKAPTWEAPTGSPAPKETNAPTGSSETVDAPPAAVSQASTDDSAKAKSRSLCVAFQDSILKKLDQGLTAQRVFQDLCDEHGFTGKYSSVRRFVRALGERREQAFRRMEVEPGYELQVDYGTGARCREENGKLRRTHVFRCVLSHSRKAYTEAVFRQTTESFVRTLENAFRALGGVPRTVVFDNAKSAVTQADWYDPVLNPKIVEFCRHYGFAFLPTRPRTPRHKGKVERGVAYVQSNALRGRVFESLAAQNAHLQEWEKRVADTRIHGTTKRQVGELFESVERAALGPLPRELFPCFHEGRRRVGRDGHLEVQRAYYSAPPEYLGCDVWVRWNEKTVRLLNDRFEQICLHLRKEPGRFSTHDAHIAKEKIGGVERGAAFLLGKVRLIGPQSLRWAEATLTERGIEGLRTVQGLLHLSHKHSVAELERACEAAWRNRGFSYRVVKELLKRQGAVQATLEFLDSHPVIRPVAEYGDFLRNVLQGD